MSKDEKGPSNALSALGAAAAQPKLNTLLTATEGARAMNALAAQSNALSALGAVAAQPKLNALLTATEGARAMNVLAAQSNALSALGAAAAQPKLNALLTATEGARAMNVLAAQSNALSALGAAAAQPKLNALLTATEGVRAMDALAAQSNAFSVHMVEAVKMQNNSLLPPPIQASNHLLDAVNSGQNARSGGRSIVRSVADLGRKIVATRKSMKMTQQTFADLAGVGRRFLSELEAGKPTLEFERVLKVCQAAGIDLIAVKR